MCLILFAWKTHPKHDLILAANRDEFYNRPTQPAHFWHECPYLLAGKDLTGGGTWIGITKSGKIAALTNYRDLQNINPDAPSRGQLTTDFLTSDITPEKYLEGLDKNVKRYNGYNLLVGDEDSFWYFNNVNHRITELQPGIYGLSNGLLNDPWPKVERGKSELVKCLESDSIDPDILLNFLKNDQMASDDQLPKTGVPLAWERSLSPLFITTENYGTRCSTVILKKTKSTLFLEQTHSIKNQKEQRIQIVI